MNRWQHSSAGRLASPDAHRIFNYPQTRQPYDLKKEKAQRAFSFLLLTPIIAYIDRNDEPWQIAKDCAIKLNVRDKMPAVEESQHAEEEILDPLGGR